MIVIYDSSKASQRGFVKIRNYKRKFLEILASSLITFSIVSLLFYFYPILREEIKYRNVKQEFVKVGFGDLILKMDAYDASVEGLDPYYSISIPKIDAKATIIPNVDPNNPDEYMIALKKGVAHAKGTNFPGQNKNIYLFSHSTTASPLYISRYNAVFYLLRKLSVKDKIYIYFLSKKYVYEVTEVKRISSNDTSWLQDQGIGEVLILQTCDPPGTTINRLIVVAKPL
jgi:LPXTG-site transpeptidase (sortase) family protein